MIWHGVYRLFPRKVGFRNDYCMTCRAPRRAEQVRTFDVLHLKSKSPAFKKPGGDSYRSATTSLPDILQSPKQYSQHVK